MVQLQWLRCNTFAEEKLRAEICIPIFVILEFFPMREAAHLLQCKASKHAALLHGLNRSLRFSTLFFTELLKRCRNYWKQICAASHKKNISVKQKLSCGRMIKLMPRKKKNKPAATAKKQKGRIPGTKTKPAPKPSAKKTSAKKQKNEPEILPVLNDAKLKELYAAMVKCRMLAERMQNDRTAGNGNSVLGFEATLVGAGAHLLAKDCIAMEHSSFVASLIRGTPLRSILVARNKKEESGNGTDKAIFSKHDGNAIAALNVESVLALAVEMKSKGAVTLMFCRRNPKTLIFDPTAM